jgi:hypothetical protein
VESFLAACPNTLQREWQLAFVNVDQLPEDGDAQLAQVQVATGVRRKAASLHLAKSTMRKLRKVGPRHTEAHGLARRIRARDGAEMLSFDYPRRQRKPSTPSLTDGHRCCSDMTR